MLQMLLVRVSRVRVFHLLLSYRPNHLPVRPARVSNICNIELFARCRDPPASQVLVCA